MMFHADGGGAMSQLVHHLWQLLSMMLNLTLQLVKLMGLDRKALLPSFDNAHRFIDESVPEGFNKEQSL